MSQNIVAKRAANALLADAEARLPPLTPWGHQTEATLDRFKAAHRGLWVGGRATLTEESLSFHPNSVNRGLHSGRLDFEIPLPDITSVEVLSAFVSSVIVIRTAGSDVRIRCFRAQDFGRQIAQHAGAGFSKAADGRFRMRLSGD
jgi:hypothetical protein